MNDSSRPAAFLLRRRSALPRGQSLVEFALSISFLLLVFSGAVDLGRAYFFWIQVQSAASDGTQWAAAYPDCIANDTDSQSGSPDNCQGSNSILERVLNEDTYLNRNDYVCVKAIISHNGVILADPSNLQRGDDVEIRTKFQVRLVTPIMRGLFGDTLAIYGDVHETIRGVPGVTPPMAPAVTPSQTLLDEGGVTVGCAIP